jgi:hypothetical protein
MAPYAMMRKGQVRWLPKGDVVEKVRFIERVFGIAASLKDPTRVRSSIHPCLLATKPVALLCSPLAAPHQSIGSASWCRAPFSMQVATHPDHGMLQRTLRPTPPNNREEN